MRKPVSAPADCSLVAIALARQMVAAGQSDGRACGPSWAKATRSESSLPRGSSSPAGRPLTSAFRAWRKSASGAARGYMQGDSHSCRRRQPEQCLPAACKHRVVPNMRNVAKALARRGGARRLKRSSARRAVSPVDEGSAAAIGGGPVAQHRHSGLSRESRRDCAFDTNPLAERRAWPSAPRRMRMAPNRGRRCC